VNKIRNASRFALMYIDTELKSTSKLNLEQLRVVERWILSRFDDDALEVNKSLSRTASTKQRTRSITSSGASFCDWYIEMA
jgi:valyl-tRNA synthetase